MGGGGGWGGAPCHGRGLQCWAVPAHSSLHFAWLLSPATQPVARMQRLYASVRFRACAAAAIPAPRPRCPHPHPPLTHPPTHPIPSQPTHPPTPAPPTHPCRKLHLYNNMSGDEGAAAIARLLERCPNLQVCAAAAAPLPSSVGQG